MGKGLKRLGVISAILAFVICLMGGFWVLRADFEVGVGIYFIGKAFFVGPLLLITTFKKTAIQS